MQPWQNGKPLEEDSVPPYFVFTARCNEEDNRARSLAEGTIAHQDMRFNLKRDVLSLLALVSVGLTVWGLYKLIAWLGPIGKHGALS